MRFDPEKLKQALQETLFTAVAAFLVVFAAFLMGLKQLPNLEALKSVWNAGELAALVAVGKGIFWYFTGTKIEPGAEVGLGKRARRLKDEKGYGLVEVALFLLILVIALVILTAAFPRLF